MKKIVSRKNVIGATVVAAALVGGLGVGMSASAAWVNSPTDQSSTRYPLEINKGGQSYGSIVDAETSEDAPDLISVFEDDGVREGYVLKTDYLDEYQPATPEEAAKWLASEESKKPRVLTVYESDGKTKIGTFTIEP